MDVKLAERMIAEGILAPEVLRQAGGQQSSAPGELEATLLKMGAITREDLLAFLSKVYNVPSVSLENLEISPSAINSVPADVAMAFRVIPIEKIARILTLAMVDPGNIFAIEDIKFITGLEVHPVVCTEKDLAQAQARCYGEEEEEQLSNIMKDLTDEQVEVIEDLDPELSESALEEDAPVVKFVNSLIADAVKKGISDIHMEPYERNMRVRFRLDGTLYEMMSPPLKMKSAIISRLKIMAELDIAERRIPQDGRIKIKVQNRTVDLRVSTLPTIFGEKIVLRILDRSNLNINLSTLGFEKKALEAFTTAIRAPYGMVLVTGPTGSGKTTTLYSALSLINTPDTNILTAEDPVEYNLDGINQVLVNEEVGLTFAAALRAFLRQDPNIVMVGEIRDGETGSIATKAALTGHLVLSTLHTNDAPSTIDRLIDMGIEPFLVASSVNLVLAQRLVRRVCKHCAVELEKHPEILIGLGLKQEDVEGATLLRGEGCPQCNDSGYSGRQGLYEVMPMSKTIRQMVLDRCSSEEIRTQAIEEGMLTLRQDAIQKLKRGVTTVQEVLRETSAD